MRKPLRTETEGVHFFLRHLSDGQRNAGETIPVLPDQRCEQVNRERRRKAETQRTARGVLNIADLLREGGLGYMQRPGSAGEAAVVRDGLQIADGDNSISLAYGALRKSVLDSYSSNAQLCL